MIKKYEFKVLNKKLEQAIRLSKSFDEAFKILTDVSKILSVTSEQYVD